MKFSWQKLPKPFFTLAPMEGATDTVFRQIIISCARPDVLFTEFTNTDGIISEKAKHVTDRLMFKDLERPIIAQIWGTNPKSFYESSKKLSKMKFDGIDINMGCPERNIIKKGSCAGLMKNPDLAKEIIEATKKGAGKLPVSVKTRIGFSQIQMKWIEFLLNQNISALTIHLRTALEMSKTPAHWGIAEKIVELRDKIYPDTVLIGNGDVENVIEAEMKIKESGFDGIMIGRGVFHDPYAFSSKIRFNDLPTKDKLELLEKHLDLFEKIWGEDKTYNPLKRFFKVYINSFKDAGDLREKLMETSSISEAREILNEYKNEYMD